MSCLIWFCFSSVAFAQSEADSLREVWRNSQATDSSRFHAMQQLVDLAQTPEASTTLLRQLEGWAEIQGYREAQLWAWMKRSDAHQKSGAIDSAWAALQHALELTRAWQDPEKEARVRIAQGFLAYGQGRYEKAEGYFQAVLADAPKELQAKAWKGLGNIAYRQASYAEAETAYRQVIGLYQPDPKYKGKLPGAWFNLAIAQENQGKVDSAMYAYEQARIQARASGEEGVLSYVYYSMTNIAADQGDYRTALAYSDSSLRLAESSGNLAAKGQALEAKATIFLDQEEWRTGVSYAHAALALYQQAGEKGLIAGGFNFLGTAHMTGNQLDSALLAYENSLEIAQEVGMQALICGLNVNIGQVYRKKGELTPAIAYLEKGLALSEEWGFDDYRVNALGNLSEVLFLKGEYAQAAFYCEQGLQLSQELGTIRQAYALYEILSRAYESLGRPGPALRHYRTYISFRDSLKSEENRAAVIRMEYQQQALQDSLTFVQQQAEAELAYQAQLSQRNLLLTGTLVVLLFGALGFLFFRYRQQQRNRERDLELTRERERKEQLAALDQLKSRFFANISHELRTPLTLILGQNQSLQAELDDPRVDAKFDMVDRNGRRLLELVNQVLDLSKLESGRLQLNLQTFDLLPFMKNLLFSFESLADQKRQQLRFQSREESLLMVADPEKLERVFFNLLSNAVKFTPEGGSITVKLQMVAHRVHVGVIDTGGGIPADQQAQIFDRFYQAEGGANHPSPGTGIGLALVKELVELHQGEVQVESEVGAGSAFWINMPLNAGVASDIPTSYEPRLEPLEVVALPAPPKKKGSGTSKSAQGERILIVEDNPDVRSFLRQELEGMGYAVVEAEDGQVGLVKARAEQPDLIISDVMMPKMDGFELAQAIRADANCSHVPLILLTAKGSEESRITGLQTGVDDYLTKPFNTRELQARVANLIAQRKRLREKFATALTIKPEEVSAVPMDQQFLQQVTDTIETHLTDEQFGVESLAEAANMSVTHLNRKLKALIGQTAGKLIRSMRLQRAADLLRQEAGNVSDIGYELCFSDPTNFARAFRAQFGVTPSQYQAQNTGKSAPD